MRRLPHKSHQTAEPTVSRFVRKNERGLSDYERKQEENCILDDTNNDS